MGFKINDISNTPNRLDKEDQTSFLKQEIHLFRSKFNNKQKQKFYLQLSVLLNAGITLREALQLISDSEKNKNLKLLFNNIIDRIVEGKSFANALEECKDISPYEYNAIKIGEETGTLAKVSDLIGEFFTRKNEQKKTIINALTYPAVIVSTAFLVVLFMLQFVVPMFEDIFKQQNIDLPYITLLIIDVSDFLSDYGWIVFFLIILVIIVNKYLNKLEKIRRIKDMILIKTPILGSFIKHIYIAQFIQSVSLLIIAKLPLVNAIGLVIKMIDFHPLKKALKDVKSDLIDGLSLSQSLSKHESLFDKHMIAMVKVSEETNQTAFVFTKLNEHYDQKIQQQSKTLSALLEPVIIVVVGAFVAVILVAMYLPMFKLSSVIG